MLEQEPVSEQNLLSIPSLPTNQQQGRHNLYNPTKPAEIKDDKPLSSAPLPMPAPPPAPAQEEEPAATPASAPVATSPATPPWLEQMRDDLLDCEGFFCREKVRKQYCTSQWESLPECKSKSL